jgi:hypothetical protein
LAVFILNFEESMMSKKFKILGKATFLALILTAAIVGVALAVDSTSALNYQIDFLGAEKSGNTSTWTYAITSSGDEANGLSHWTLELGSCYAIVAPTNSYTTPTNLDVCTGGTYDCQAANYTVVTGNDPTTGLSGIKFEDPSPALSSSNIATHIFEITLQNDGEHFVADEIDVAVKAGSNEEVSRISGPGCLPTAVSLVSFGASQGNNNQIGTFLVVIGALSLLGFVVQRKFKQAN